MTLAVRNHRFAAIAMLCLMSLTRSAQAWTAPAFGVSTTARGVALHQSTEVAPAETVEDISLDMLDADHEVEGALLSQSVAAWLDAEWMPQEIHVKMGESAKRSYVHCREEGDDEIMSIMMKVAEDLTENWFEVYNADAFVNAWDVANYVSDYLTQKSGSESCACATPIH
eukprot:CAMPEP_0198135348 /NCGR_PEP_ID=MMETSP1442-20131203/60541_1 /TAXON_ID= /ORGANISM="Craspedostauros australis, Strain CCMP3328" /LENGTH=169 /DNA_ID=CAMNT_0043796513 /DNA_START=512 /DNA_END=1021 /DNA_ORIENTATION=-